jgi:NTE family protein
MVVKSSNQLSRSGWLKRYPVPRNFKVEARSRIDGRNGSIRLRTRFGSIAATRSSTAHEPVGKAWNPGKAVSEIKKVMASGALPPGFPAIEIEGEHYWDGGVVSNTPLSRVLSGDPRDILTFQVDLWSAKGRVPHDLMEVSSRQKDIQYSSRTRAITDQTLEMQKMRQALQRTIELLQEAAKLDPEIRAIAEVARPRAYNIIHLIYQSKTFESHSKDYEFGPSAMRAHWQSGLDDIRRTLADPRRLDPPPPELGIITHDVHRPA